MSVLGLGVSLATKVPHAMTRSCIHPIYTITYRHGRFRDFRSLPQFRAAFERQAHPESGSAEHGFGYNTMLTLVAACEALRHNSMPFP